MTRNRIAALLAGIVALALLPACRGQVSKSPPIHPNWNMDAQKRVDAQEPDAFFANGAGSRMFVEGTVRGADPRGDDLPCTLADENPHLCAGKVGEAWATALPAEIKLDAALLDRGQDRYDIFCATCHDRVGNAQAVVAKRGMPAIGFHNDGIRLREVGKFYDTITNGGAIMPGYGKQIPVEDRWAIAAYMRALQLSQYASIEQVPAEVARSKGWK